ncbi:MAG: hypothetical protein K8H90_08370, partial [Thermoanaerobaculia bacterium]|nr:hypothetical protein [Thermoanaerobaculia bacterium]
MRTGFDAVRAGGQILQSVEDGLNSLSEALGGTGDEFRGFAGTIPGATRVIEETKNALFNGAAALAAFEDTQG